MARVERQSVKANIRTIATRLDEALRAVMTLLAQALKRAKPEVIDIAVMRLNVIADRRRCDDAALCAILTQRVLEQLVPSDSSPASRGVPLIPLCLPAANTHRSTYHPPAGAQQAPGQQRNGSSIVTKVLYVEDNDDNVFMLKMRLELLGDFEVLTAEDGEKGCAMAISESPDIILMDLEMPNVDGWEATRRLKGDPQTRDIPIIALSAHALAGERKKALAAGCNEFDTKPIEFDRLVATLRRILASHK